MYKGKARYLERLTSRLRLRSVSLKEKIAGSTPPSVFIGRKGYPKVYIGPMLAAAEESTIFDLPEEWLSQRKEALDIIDFRLQLVRGKTLAKVDERNRMIEKLQEIALSKSSIGMEAEFSKKPRGYFLHEEMQPFGPSAPLKSFDVEKK